MNLDLSTPKIVYSFVGYGDIMEPFGPFVHVRVNDDEPDNGSPNGECSANLNLTGRQQAALCPRVVRICGYAGSFLHNFRITWSIMALTWETCLHVEWTWLGQMSHGSR